MIVRTSFYLSSSLLGSGEWETPRICLPDNVAFFCRRCGEVWGRVVHSAPSPAPSIWVCQLSPCARHSPAGVRDWAYVPGSFLGQLHYPDQEGRAVLDLPLPVLRHEFAVHCRRLDAAPIDSQGGLF